MRKTCADLARQSCAGWVAPRYDTTDNYLPPEEFERDKYLTSSEWYWVPAKAAGAAERAPATKLETRDPPTRTLVEFAAKQLGASLDVEAVMARFEEETKASRVPTNTRPHTQGRAPSSSFSSPPSPPRLALEPASRRLWRLPTH